MNRLEKIHQLYRTITNTLIRRKLTISAMESCTSGLLASMISDTEGSSAILGGSLVTYSNDSKIRVGVDPKVIENFGVYSLETAIEMAGAVRSFFPADLCIGITGSLSNVDPNNSDSVAGEVYYSILFEGQYTSQKIILTQTQRFEGKLEVLEYVGEKLLSLLQ